MKALILSLFMLLVYSSMAQYSSEYSDTKNASKSLQIAQQFINSDQFEKAYHQLRHTVKIKENFAVAYRELGKVCLEIKKYKESYEALEKSFELDDKLSRAAFFECGEAYFNLANVEKAKLYYAQYTALKGTDYANKEKESGLELTFDKLLEERQRNCEYIASLDLSYTDIQPVNLGKSINSDHDEYLPTTTSDGEQIVFTRQKSKDNEDVMISHFMKGKWSKSRSFGKEINTKKNEGMAKFATHGKAFYFAGCMRSDTEGGCDIYKAELSRGEVTKVSRVEGNLNSEYWDSQPSITCDGHFMYFSSSRIGGSGGADIWVSRLKENGDWSVPENLGNNINSEGDEEAPFISSDGMTLYFTSNGHEGQGDGDIFISRKINDQWSEPINLDYPINSPAKELGFYVQGNGKTAFFASAKIGGEGGLDIYSIELPEEFRPNPMVHLEGFVRDNQSNEPVSATVTIGRENDKWIAKTDENGWFFICLPGNRGYSFQVDKEGYKYYIEAAFFEAQENVKPVVQEIFLQPILPPQAELVSKGVPISEKRIQIFFEFDSYSINNNAEEELKRLSAFLENDEDWKVEVVGYADNKGDFEYNKILSKKRANAIVDYLKKNGIKIENVVRNEGKGSIKSKDKNTNKFRRVDIVLRKF
jgi:outer membrane protein OmpA-like peptidoglycan-associated protein/tetratricopeptide (TPR) repeat protein